MALRAEAEQLERDGADDAAPALPVPEQRSLVVDFSAARMEQLEEDIKASLQRISALVAVEDYDEVRRRVALRMARTAC